MEIGEKILRLNKSREFKSAVDLWENSDWHSMNPIHLNKAKAAVAVTWYHIGEAEKFISYIDEALNFLTQEKDFSYHSFIYYHIGKYEHDKQDYESSIENFKLAEGHLKENTIQSINAAKLANAQGALLMLKEEYDSAIELLNKSIELYEFMGNFSEAAYPYGNLARIYQKQGNENMAIACLERGIENLKASTFLDRIAELKMLQCISYLSLNEKKKASEVFHSIHYTSDLFFHSNSEARYKSIQEQLTAT